ncbi:hypothetical protein DFH11DRAFT_1690154 [Phellopilus nigrolimitatus]|nr:hypothetical protein DFH11DRAFT_1690154 [Phellopilus nigrolimitatus]
MTSKADGKQGDKTARVHTNKSNRKTKERLESKTVFKSVLDNPFDVKWPVIALNVQNTILARVVELMQGTAEYNLSRHKESQVKRRTRKKTHKDSAAEGTPMQQDTEAGPSSVPAAAPPEILQHVTVGINEVTKRLEAQCRIPRQVLSVSDGDQDMTDAAKIPSASARASVRIVLVCRSDVDPPLLVSHIPHLVAACNCSLGPSNEIMKLVTLPKGAEISLAQAMGLRRAAVMAFDETLSQDESLRSLLCSVPPVVAPWLTGIAVPPSRSTQKKSKIEPPRRAQVLHKRLEPTHIKQLRTTAPKDMRAAKAQRAKGRAEAKAKRKAKEGAKKSATKKAVV